MTDLQKVATLVAQRRQQNKEPIDKVASLVAQKRQQQGITKEAGMNKVAVSLSKQLAVLLSKYKGNLGDMTAHLKGMKSLKGAQKFRQALGGQSAQRLFKQVNANNSMLNNMRHIGRNDFGKWQNIYKSFNNRGKAINKELHGILSTGKGSKTALQNLMFNKIQGNSLLTGLGTAFNKGYKAFSTAKGFLADFFGIMKMRGESLLSASPINVPIIAKTKNQIKQLTKDTANKAMNRYISDLLPM